MGLGAAIAALLTLPFVLFITRFVFDGEPDMEDFDRGGRRFVWATWLVVVALAVIGLAL